MSLQTTYEYKGETYPAEIGKVESTMLGYEGHGILTAYLTMDFGGSGQGIGGYGFDEPIHVDGEFVGRRGGAFGMEWVARMIRACGVESWEQVKGRTVIVLRDGEQWSGRVIGVAPLPSEKGEPFLFAELQESMSLAVGA